MLTADEDFQPLGRAQNKHRKIKRLSTDYRTPSKIDQENNSIDYSLILNLFYNGRMVKEYTIYTMEFFSSIK